MKGGREKIEFDDPAFADIPYAMQMALQHLCVATEENRGGNPPLMEIHEFIRSAGKVICKGVTLIDTSVPHDVPCMMGDECAVSTYMSGYIGVVPPFCEFPGVPTCVSRQCILCSVVIVNQAIQLTCFAARRSINPFQLRVDDSGQNGIVRAHCIPFGTPQITGAFPLIETLGITPDPRRGILVFTSLLNSNVSPTSVYSEIVTSDGHHLPRIIMPMHTNAARYSGGFYAEGLPRVCATTWREIGHDGQHYIRSLNISELLVAYGHDVWFPFLGEMVDMISRCYQIYPAAGEKVRLLVDAIINSCLPLLYTIGFKFPADEHELMQRKIPGTEIHLTDRIIARVMPHPSFVIWPGMLPVVPCLHHDVRVQTSQFNPRAHLMTKIMLSRGAGRKMVTTLIAILEKNTFPELGRIIRDSLLCMLLGSTHPPRPAIPLDIRIAVYIYVRNIPHGSEFCTWLTNNFRLVDLVFYYLRLASVAMSPVSTLVARNIESRALDAMHHYLPLITVAVVRGETSVAESMCSTVMKALSKKARYETISVSGLVHHPGYFSTPCIPNPCHLFYCEHCRKLRTWVRWGNSEEPIKKRANSTCVVAKPPPRMAYQGTSDIAIRFWNGNGPLPDDLGAHCIVCGNAPVCYDIANSLVFCEWGAKTLAVVGCGVCGRAMELSYAKIGDVIHCGCGPRPRSRIGCMVCGNTAADAKIANTLIYGRLFAVGPSADLGYLCPKHVDAIRQLAKYDEGGPTAYLSLTSDELATALKMMYTSWVRRTRGATCKQRARARVSRDTPTVKRAVGRPAKK